MNNTTIQPQGYSQFLQNYAAAHRSGAAFAPVQSNVQAPVQSSVQTPASQNPSAPANSQDEGKKSKFKMPKNGKLLIAAGIAATVLYGISYYKKGVKAINLKNEMVGADVKTDEAFRNFVQGYPFSSREAYDIAKTWENGMKYTNNWVGKLHNGFQHVTEFFKKHFYNY